MYIFCALQTSKHKLSQFATPFVALVCAVATACAAQTQMPRRSSAWPPPPVPHADQIETAQIAPEEASSTQVDRRVGSAEFLGKPEAGISAQTAGGNSAPTESFIYRDAALDTVLNAVLSETYGLSFAIDPTIQDRITIRLENIASADQAVEALSGALRMQGYNLILQNSVYYVTRRGDTAANEVGGVALIGPNGLVPKNPGSAAIMLQNSRAEDISNILSELGFGEVVGPFVESRNMILLSGDPIKVTEAAQVAASLDVDWLSAISTAIIAINYTSASAIQDELETIFRQDGTAEFIALDRLNSLLVLSQSDQKIDQVLSWIDRLDRQAEQTLSNDTLVYEPMHLNAVDLVASVGELFSGEQSAGVSTPNIQSPSLGTSGPDLSLSRPDNSPLGPSISTVSEDGLKISADQNRNVILARGNNAALNDLRSVLRQLDQPQQQVLIEATIVEANLTNELRYGVQWSLIEDQIRETFTDAASGAVSSRFPGFSLAYVSADIEAVVNALANVTDVEVISSPRVTTLNNRSALLQVGDQVPVISQTAVSVTDPNAPVVNSVNFRDTGVILSVTPRIRSGGLIEIDIIQEVSGVSETTTSGIDSPTISQRRIQSTLVVPDGSTAVLGGLMSSTRSLTETGVPVLKDVPVLGKLFSATGDADRRSELVILIRPTLVTDQQRRPALSARLVEALMRLRPEMLR
ncbi:secretin N-terminal domain-containing protein [Henriciella algicola]|uniref:Uncharacterized protein n=1 Tax=Henriciella algicola TaxID=1608422 RepID=A0A399RJA6_9PROT|nr:secretin N-terminal domain-containing protein [Henriciella algicola]RIJ29809.1 hypothetical protein D1222_08200 [Henriciella algicola]